MWPNLCIFQTRTPSLRHSQLTIFDSQFVLPHFYAFKKTNLQIWALEIWNWANSENSPICQVTLEECLINKLRHAQITVRHVPERIGQRNSLGCSSQRNHQRLHELGRIFNIHSFRLSHCHFPWPNYQCSTKSYVMEIHSKATRYHLQALQASPTKPRHSICMKTQII